MDGDEILAKGNGKFKMNLLKLSKLARFFFQSLLISLVFISLPIWWPFYVTLQSLPGLWHDEIKRMPRIWWNNLLDILYGRA